MWWSIETSPRNQALKLPMFIIENYVDIGNQQNYCY